MASVIILPVMETMRPRVGLDGLFLSEPHTGSGQYSLHLSRYLLDAREEPQTVLLRPAMEGVKVETSANGASVSVPSPSWARSGKVSKLWWEQRGVVKAARLANVDLLHTPYFSAPRIGSLSRVTTIHDVIPLVFPEYGGSMSMRLYLRLVSASARRAIKIITDSDCSRRDIIRYLGIPASRIVVIPLAVDDRYRPHHDPDTEHELRERFGLPGPVVFNMGGLDVRKNLAALVEAFAMALPETDPDTRLVIGGRAHSGNDQLYPPLEPVIRKAGLEGKVILTGSISEEEKIALYNLADLFVFPSLYEGFGFPPLEAMACGTPVIAANRASLPEVVGHGGLQVDPIPQRLAAAMVSVLTDEHLRRTLAQRAAAQAGKFSWQRTAEMTRDVYREALSLPLPVTVGSRTGA